MELSTNNEVIKSTKPPMTPVLIVSQNEEGKPNIMTAEWYMRTSIEPPMFAISIGNIRHTHTLLQQ